MNLVLPGRFARIGELQPRRAGQVASGGVAGGLYPEDGGLPASLVGCGTFLHRFDGATDGHGAGHLAPLDGPGLRCGGAQVGQNRAEGFAGTVKVGGLGLVGCGAALLQPPVERLDRTVRRGRRGGLPDTLRGAEAKRVGVRGVVGCLRLDQLAGRVEPFARGGPVALLGEHEHEDPLRRVAGQADSVEGLDDLLFTVTMLRVEVAVILEVADDVGDAVGVLRVERERVPLVVPAHSPPPTPVARSSSVATRRIRWRDHRSAKSGNSLTRRLPSSLNCIRR